MRKEEGEEGSKGKNEKRSEIHNFLTTHVCIVVG